MQHRRIFFRILYGSIYVLFFLLLVGLLLITPGDVIERSIHNDQRYNVLILTISYVATVFTVVFVYILRLYITKTALDAIPKAWVPIDKGDVKDSVYRMIHHELDRSAAIAYVSRPREPIFELDGNVRTGENCEQGEEKPRLRCTKTIAEDLGLPLLPSRPVWGEIEHYGWASPYSSDLRNLQYSKVLSELPNLIEGKALLLAPTQAANDSASVEQSAVLDPEATDLLQRMPNMTMRDYLDHLSSLGVIPMDNTSALFLTHYEYARFSNRPISNARFRELMHLLAELLRAMQPLDLKVMQSNEDNENYGWGPSESDMDIDNDAPLYTDPPSPRSSISRGTLSSVRQQRPLRTSSAHEWSSRAVPNTPRSRRAGALSRKSSETSLAQIYRRHHTASSQPSSASLRSRITGSSDSGSVIRLSTKDDPEALPYVLNLQPTTGS